MSRYAAVDLTTLPLPAAVAPVAYETILADLKAQVIAYAPEVAAALELESEPIVKVLEVWAFFEMQRVARANDQLRAVHLATAAGSDLDGLAALFGVTRLLLRAEDLDAVPPVAAIYEDDAGLRRRAQQALESFSTAGPVGAYEFHARSADGRVADVSVRSPTPGLVQVTLLSTENNGVASSDLIGVVSAALNADEVRPLTDTVFVQGASFTNFPVSAEITVAAAPGSEVVLENASAALDDYLARARRIGEVVRLSAIFAALHQPGVDQVTLSAPVADVDPGVDGVARVGAIALTMVVAE